MKAKKLVGESSWTQENAEAEAGWALVHAILGRHRYRVAALVQQPELALWLGAVLRRDKRLKSVQVRWRSGSVIIEHEPTWTIAPADVSAWWLRAQELYASEDGPAKAEDEDQNEKLDHERQGLRLVTDELLTWLGVDRRSGLLGADVEKRRQQFGPNELQEELPQAPWEIFSRQFANPQTGLLMGSAGLSLVTGGLFDVLMIGGVLFVNAYVGYIAEAHAEQVIHSIGKLDPLEIQVLREGRRQHLLDDELVVGDIVFLGIGMVPADLRLIESHGLMVDESPLTGESMPIAKHHAPIELQQIKSLSDHKNMLYRGTIITSGHGVGIVLATGERTRIGEVRRLVTQTETQPSALDRDLHHLGRQTIWFSSLVCGGVFALGLSRGLGLGPMLKTAISLAVAAVPEGLPTIGTTTMALGVSQLKRRNVLVRRLKVMEMLGGIQVLCFDKTGTLTLNEMVADQGYFGSWHWTREALKKSQPALTRSSEGDPKTLKTWIRIASLCHDCEWLEAINGEPARWSGSATEKAIIALVEELGGSPRTLLPALPRHRVSYRTEERQYMTTYHNLGSTSQTLAAVKGSPEQLLALSGYFLEGGEIIELTDESRALIEQQNRSLGKQGLRVIGFAYLEAPELRSIRDRKLIWIGLVGLKDPMREGMPELMDLFHRAGIRTIMMTGDQSVTAKAVGKALGFHQPGEKVQIADARQLGSMSPEEIAKLTETVQVFSRVSPSDKLRIVQALQQAGKIVAMTGDGINDSPALKAAHVGIAMGAQGTAAARESADVVLKDDNLKVLLHAIQQGRAIHSNLRKSIKYLLGTNLSEILLMFASVAGGQGVALNPMQLLWINLLSDILPGLALALDPPPRSSMQAAPPDPEAALLPPAVQKILVREASLMAAAAFFSHQKRAREGELSATTGAFITLTISQILHTLTASAEPEGLWRQGLPHNKRLYGAMGIAAVTLGMGMVSPMTRQLLGITSFDRRQWLEAILQGIWPLALNEAFTYFKVQTFEPNPSLH